MAEEQNPRPRRDGFAEQIQHLCRILHRRRKRDLLHHDPVALGLQIPWMLASGMLLVRHQTLRRPGFISEAVRDVAVRLGRIAKQRNLVALAAHKRGQRVAELVPRGVSPDRIVLRVLLIELLGRGIPVKDGAQHGRRTRTHGAVVEVNLVRRNEKLLPDLRPVAFCIVVQQGLLRHGRYSLKLCENLAAERDRCRYSAGGSGKKVAAVEQGDLSG